MGFFSFFSRDYYQDMTRAVSAWWASIFKPSDFYDRIDLPLSIHICGSEEVIEEKASAIYGKKIDYPGTAGLALPAPVDGRWHVFVIASEIRFKTTEINYFNLGHELAHIIDFYNERQNVRLIDYPNPDEGRE